MATAIANAAGGSSKSKKQGEMRGWLPLGAFNSLAAAAAAAAARAEAGEGGEGAAAGAGAGVLGTATLHLDFPPGAAVAALVRVAVE
jgi:hypothetical protein